jgi:hypothetical protein
MTNTYVLLLLEFFKETKKIEEICKEVRPCKNFRSIENHNQQEIFAWDAREYLCSLLLFQL